MSQVDEGEVEKEEGIPWRTIVRIIAEILKMIAGGVPVAGAIGKVAPKFGLSASKVRSLFDKYGDKAK